MHDETLSQTPETIHPALLLQQLLLLLRLGLAQRITTAAAATVHI
jgi:hypothetical protein